MIRKQVTVRYNNWIILMAVLCVFTTGCKKSQTTAEQPLPAEALKTEMSIVNAPSALKQGATVKMDVKVKNIGSALLPSKADEKNPIVLSYHWYDAKGNTVVWDGTRSALPNDVKPGDEVVVNADVTAPKQPGEYILEFDMIQEFVFWFKDKGSKTAQTKIMIN